MSFSQTFPSTMILKPTDFRTSMIYIQGVYKSLGMSVNVKFMVRSGIPTLYMSGKAETQIVVFTPYMEKSGAAPRKLTFREKSLIDLDQWHKWYFLGFSNSNSNQKEGSLIPYAVQKNNISPEYLKKSESGCYFLSPELVAENDLLAYKIISLAEIMASEGVLNLSFNNYNDFLLLEQLLALKGGKLLSKPINQYERGKNDCLNIDSQYNELISGGSQLVASVQVYCQLPDDYDQTQLKIAMGRIKAGTLPLERYSGFWNLLPINITVGEIYRRKMIFHLLGTLAYVKLAEKYPYLAYLIYEVKVNGLLEIMAPIATLEQKIEYEIILKNIFQEYSVDNFFLVEYQNNTDLILKRFAYEKYSELVFVPKTPISEYDFFAPNYILVFGSHVLSEEEIQREKNELEMLIRRRPELLGPDREKRCLANCGLERSVCCVDILLPLPAITNKAKNQKLIKHNKGKHSHHSVFNDDDDNGENLSLRSGKEKSMIRLENRDLEAKMNILGSLSLTDKERLLHMEKGLQGYFSVGGVLKGLYSNPPLPLIYSQSVNGENNDEVNVKVINLEANILLYALEFFGQEKMTTLPLFTSSMALPQSVKMGIEDDMRKEILALWKSGELMTPWRYALLNY